MLAWARDIPIINIESSWKEDGPLLQKSLEQSFNRVMFQQQLIPYYGSDADISQSKKKKKFTIT
jgi:hypothetical protein